MTIAEKIILCVMNTLFAVFVFYTIARFRVNEQIMNQTVRKMVEKVDHYDHVLALLDLRINALADRAENRGKERNE